MTTRARDVGGGRSSGASPAARVESWRVACVGVAVAVFSLLGSGCGSPDLPAAGGGGGSSPIGDAGGACLTPAAGCPCASPGQTADCGRVVQASAGYVTCSIGTTTCTNGTWGTCTGSLLTTKRVGSGMLHFDAYGVAMPCSPADACDPSCVSITDTGTGIDAGSAFTSNDGGISLVPTFTTPPTCTGLQINPNMSPATDLNVNVSMAPSPSTISFSASLNPPGCYSGAVPALWNIDQYDIAQISSGGLLTLVSPVAGPITVSAFSGTLVATPVVAHITVNVKDVSAIPAGYTAASFSSAGTMADPSLTVLYPYAGTVFPLGLPPPLIQWRTASPAGAVMVTLRYPAASPIFTWSEIVSENQTQPTPSLAGQPRATIPQSVWDDFQQTVVRNAGTLGFSGVFAIQRIVSGTLYKEVATNIVTANGQLKGSVFYSSYGTNLISGGGNYQYTLGGARFGAATLSVPVNGLTPTVVAGAYSAGTTGTGCRVCHSASSQGNRLLTNLFSPNDKTTSTFDLTTSPATETALGPATGDGKFSWAALSPDGTYLYTNSSPAPGTSTPNLQGSSEAYSSAIFNTSAVAQATVNQPTALKAATPSFSPDAAHIAFNFYKNTPTPLVATAPATGDGKTISMMDFTPGTNTFSNFRNLYTPASGYAAWPVFLPPGQNGLVFEHEIRNNGRDWAGTREDNAFDCTAATCSVPVPAAPITGTTAELWWVSTGAVPQASVLGNLNGTGGSAGIAANYLPTGGNQHGNPANGTYNDTVYNYEPTVLPTTVGGYNWVVFTSRRMYGNVATVNPYFSDPRYHDISVQPTPKKLWVAAISQNPTAGTDPSFPAFYLPGQELLAGNARAYFVSAKCETAGPPLSAANVCNSNLDCCGAPATAVCQLDPPPLANPPVRHCVATSSASCVADGMSCTADAQCCKFATGSRCASGTCAPAPPIPGYSTASTQRLYVGTCPAAQSVVWRYFYWTATTPAGTQIQFTAQTSISGPPWGPAVAIADTSMAGKSTLTVDASLKAANQVSQSQLLVTATFVPSMSPPQTPTLSAWQVKYDCVSAE